MHQNVCVLKRSELVWSGRLIIVGQLVIYVVKKLRLVCHEYLLQHSM